MNRKEASKLVLSELEYFDDLNQEFKTYKLNEIEYKLYGSLSGARLENESQEEYKVRRIFIAERSKNRGTIVWRSRNNENLKIYNIIRNLPKEEGEQDDAFIKNIKETAMQTNLGTFNKKKLEKLVEQFKEETKQVEINEVE